MPFLFELLVELLGGVLWSSFSRDKPLMGESPLERQQTRFWRWVVGIVLFLVVLAGVYTWASHRF